MKKFIVTTVNYDNEVTVYECDSMIQALYVCQYHYTFSGYKTTLKTKKIC